MFQQTLLKIHC